MIILGLLVITVMSLLLMSVLDMLVFQKPFMEVFVQLLPVYPDTSTVLMIAAAFVMAIWMDFNLSIRLKKKSGSQGSKQGSGENRVDKPD